MIIVNNKDSAVYLAAHFRLYVKQIFNKEEMLYQQGYHQPMFLVNLRSTIKVLVCFKLPFNTPL